MNERGRVAVTRHRRGGDGEERSDDAHIANAAKPQVGLLEELKHVQARQPALLDQHGRQATARQLDAAGQPRRPGADDDNVEAVAHSIASTWEYARESAPASAAQRAPPATL